MQSSIQLQVYQDKVDSVLIANIVSAWTGISVDTIIHQGQSKILTLKDQLQADIIGQDDAIMKVVNVVYRDWETDRKSVV